MSWLDMITSGKDDQNDETYLPPSAQGGRRFYTQQQPTVLTPSASTGGAQRAATRARLSATDRNAMQRARGALTGITVPYVPVDPYAGLFQTVGTTGGSPGYDNRASVAAYYQQLRDRAGSRYGQAKMDLGEVYDQLAAMYQPMAAATAEAYDDAIAGGATESEALIAATQERINNEAAMTAAQFAEMGIDEAPMPSEAQAEAERGMSDIGANQAAWSGLMGAFSTAAQQRFQSDYLGAGETKAMAIADLVNQYQNYLNSLADQEAQAMQGAYQPGTAGTPQTVLDTLPTAVQTDIYRQMMIDRGILPDPATQVDPMANLMALLPKEWQAANLAAQMGVLSPEQMAQFEAAQATAAGYNPGEVDPLLLALGITR